MTELLKVETVIAFLSQDVRYVLVDDVTVVWSAADVTKYLLFLAQASHELVPPDVSHSDVHDIISTF